MRNIVLAQYIDPLYYLSIADGHIEDYETDLNEPIESCLELRVYKFVRIVG